MSESCMVEIESGYLVTEEYGRTDLLAKIARALFCQECGHIVRTEVQGTFHLGVYEVSQVPCYISDPRLAQTNFKFFLDPDVTICF